MAIDPELLQTGLLVGLVLVSATMVGLIMLQNGKGADAGAAFGSGGGGAMFGAQTSMSFITKATGWLAALFFIITFGLAYVARQQASTLSDVGMPSVQATEQVDAPPPLDPVIDTDFPGRATDAAPTVVPDAGATDPDVPPVK